MSNTKFTATIKGTSEIIVTKSDFIPTIQKLFAKSMRFTTASGVEHPDKMEIIYHFADDSYKLTNVRLSFKKGEEVPSISSIYLAAVLIENEIHDIFNVEFTGLALDYHQKFLLTEDSPQKPMVKTYSEIMKMAPRKRGRCHEACPAGINVPRYVRQIAEGKYAEALETVYRRNPLPAICGRVCFAPCEINCRQSLKGEPVMIRMLKRFITDKIGLGVPKSSAPRTGKKIAVIGAGPAGLVAGYYLGRKGHAVTIFDSLPRAGGMMIAGIPEYRLPRDIMDKEIDIIKQQGVEIKLNAKVESVESLLKEGYNAVLVATGAHKNMEMGVTGENCQGVHNCVTFLREVNLGKKVSLGNKVLVVGGGNSAIDAARVARRTGSKEVTMLYRRTQKEMPASEKEIHEALEEGIKIENLCAPTKIENKNGKVAVTCIRMKLGALDSSGRPRPEPIPGSDFVIEADAIISSIGQSAELPPNMGVTLNKKGKIDEIKIKGVFAAGDIVTGPASVVEAVKTGREAASQIDKYLGGDGFMAAEEKVEGDEFVTRIKPEAKPKESKQCQNPCMDANKRADGFKEVELGLDEKAAREEAGRCWGCDWTEF
ncbi:MAG: FAD-dependent oxidoreductase [Planctomycetota bacterium]